MNRYLRSSRMRVTGLLIATAIAAAAALSGCAQCAGWEGVYNPVCQL